MALMDMVITVIMDYGLFFSPNICIIYDTLWPSMDMIMAINTDKQNAYWKIERDVDKLNW